MTKLRELLMTRQRWLTRTENSNQAGLWRQEQKSASLSAVKEMSTTLRTILPTVSANTEIIVLALMLKAVMCGRWSILLESARILNYDCFKSHTNYFKKCFDTLWLPWCVAYDVEDDDGDEGDAGLLCSGDCARLGPGYPFPRLLRPPPRLAIRHQELVRFSAQITEYSNCIQSLNISVHFAKENTFTCNDA